MVAYFHGVKAPTTACLKIGHVIECRIGKRRLQLVWQSQQEPTSARTPESQRIKERDSKPTSKMKTKPHQDLAGHVLKYIISTSQQFCEVEMLSPVIVKHMGKNGVRESLKIVSSHS